MYINVLRERASILQATKVIDIIGEIRNLWKTLNTEPSESDKL